MGSSIELSRSALLHSGVPGEQIEKPVSHLRLSTAINQTMPQQHDAHQHERCIDNLLSKPFNGWTLPSLGSITSPWSSILLRTFIQTVNIWLETKATYHSILSSKSTNPRKQNRWYTKPTAEHSEFFNADIEGQFKSNHERIMICRKSLQRPQFRVSLYTALQFRGS